MLTLYQPCRTSHNTSQRRFIIFNASDVALNPSGVPTLFFAHGLSRGVSLNMDFVTPLPTTRSSRASSRCVARS